MWKIGAFVILVLIILFYWSATPAPVVSTFVSTPLNCPSPSVMNIAQNYYNSSSDYAGMYTMDPISSVQSSDTTCDIKYQMTPVPGGSRTKTDIDWRRFTFADSNSGWNVTDMGEWKSGTLNT